MFKKIQQEFLQGIVMQQKYWFKVSRKGSMIQTIDKSNDDFSKQVQQQWWIEIQNAAFTSKG